MFFARFVVWADGLFPAHWKFTWRLRAMFNYFDCRKKVIAWHRAELEELDSGYALQQAGLRLDSRYPTLSELEPSRSRRVAHLRGSKE